MRYGDPCQRVSCRRGELGYEGSAVLGDTADREAQLVRASPPGRPQDEYRSAHGDGSPVSPSGRPKGEYPSAQRDGTPMSAAGDAHKEGNK